MVSHKIDKDQLREVQMILASVGKSVDPIIYRSINKTIDRGQTKAISSIYKIVNLTKTRIRKDFKKYKAFSKRLSGKLLAEGKPVGFMSFSGTKELARGGVSVKIRRDKPRFKMSHAFIGKGVGGQEQVFEREDWWGRPFRPGYPYANMPKSHRMPLDRLSAIAIEDYFADDRMYKPVQEFCSQFLSDETLRQIEFELSKL